MRRLLLPMLVGLGLGAPGLPAIGESVVLGLSRDEVAITATFDGSDILIFGAVKRDKPPPSEPPLDVIITVTGPSEKITVRRKSRQFGIWINTDQVRINSAPSFYAVASTRPLAEALSQTDDLRYRISLEQTVRSIGTISQSAEAPDFLKALERIRVREGRYQLREGDIALDEDTLFRTSLSMPSNVTEGEYRTRIFLTRGGRVIATYEGMIDVRKVGLERLLHTLAQQQALLYGCLSLIVAIGSGWLASAAFARLRR